MRANVHSKKQVKQKAQVSDFDELVNSLPGVLSRWKEFSRMPGVNYSKLKPVDMQLSSLLRGHEAQAIHSKIADAAKEVGLRGDSYATVVRTDGPRTEQVPLKNINSDYFRKILEVMNESVVGEQQAKALRMEVFFAKGEDKYEVRSGVLRFESVRSLRFSETNLPASVTFPNDDLTIMGYKSQLFR